MYVGIFGDVIFSVGHLRTLTLSNFKGSTGAEWVEHKVINGKMAEDGEVHYFIIGFAPLSENRFRITDVSESWDAVIKHGLLVQCKVSLTIKEYV